MGVPGGGGGDRRVRLLVGLVAAGVVLVLLSVVGIAKIFGGEDTTIAQPDDASNAPRDPGAPDPAEGSLPDGAFATEEALPPGWEDDLPPFAGESPSPEPSPKDSETPRKKPDQRPAPLPQRLLTVGDLSRVGPGSWGVQRERLHPEAGSRPSILSCNNSVDVPPHLARVFLVPDKSDPTFPWRKGNLDIVQRLRQYDAGGGAKAVADIRAMHRSCPVRQRSGYSERWDIKANSRTSTGDVLWYRRVLNSPDPAGVDHGSDWFVVRHRDVVTMVEMRNGRSAPGGAGASLLAAIRNRLCPGGSC